MLIKSVSAIWSLVSEPSFERLGVGGVIFIIGAIIYIVNLLLGFARRGRPLPIDGIGLMVLGIGISLFLRW
ncbi:MAG TPA: hypothetical protein VNN73_10410 [Blastocatellia bacterium]|nr:hypothetical protein [Blastocatellia bacterium]